MREIKFRAKHNEMNYYVETKKPKRKDHKGWYKCNEYIMRLVTEHPFMNKRRYVPEHRLVMEQQLGRFLEPTEIIHHRDQNRSNNNINNLELQGNQSIHAKNNQNLIGKRNSHGQFICSEPIFSELKYRLYNKNTKTTRIYTLATLIGTTFRRGQFEFRGRCTGLKDKNGKEIYEGDIVEHGIDNNTAIVIYQAPSFVMKKNIKNKTWYEFILSETELQFEKIIGNIYENPELLK
jgi:hypothetical protein